jgi:hypothetical protein
VSATTERRAKHPPTPLPDASREAKRLAAVILEVLAGLRTPTQAAQATSVSLPRYYQLETRALAGLVRSCEPRAKGRQRTAASELTGLRKENERLQHEVGRQQTLVRMAQRSMGVSPPTPPPKGKRKRKTARALVTASRLRQEADAVQSSQIATSG